ncbi:MAG: hypothetical protein K1X71_11135 [Pirellulales bacterium]|nr:hypothetical protein [Pirellulales bacterium]
MRCMALAALVVCLATVARAAETSNASDPRAEAKAALERLQTWLATSSNQSGWNDFLQTDQLQAQLVTAEPDVVAVSQIISRYRSPQPGLELPRFAAVRKALERWLASGELLDKKLPEIVRAAQPAPPTEKEVAARRESLAAAVKDLDVYLDGVSTGAGWQRYLELDRLVQLAAGPPPTVEQLIPLAERFESGNRGLEMRPFRRAARALRRYVRTLRGSEAKDLAQEAQPRLEALAKALSDQQAAAITDLDPVVSAVNWLADHGQSPEVVSVVQARFPYKNLFVTVSEGFLSSSFAEHLNECEPVRETIEGTLVTGTARTEGDVLLDLVANDRRAVWNALFRGQVVSETLGRNRSARVCLRGYTDLTGNKSILVEPTGLSTQPATASADTRLVTTGIGSTSGGIRGRIVERVASRRVAEARPGGESRQSDRARRALRERLNSRADAQIADADKQYWKQFRDPLAQRGHFPDDLLFWTTPDYMLAAGTFSGPVRLGAPTLPPSWSGSPDLGLILHETAVNSLTQGLLAGETLESEDVKERMRDEQGRLPEGYDEEEEGDSWSITFADHKPIEVVFRDGSLRVTIRGQRFRSGDRQYRAMNVTATYKFENTPNGIKGVRQGELEIFPPGFVPGERRLSVAEQTLRNMLERRMGKILKPELGGEQIKLPGKLAEAGPLTASQAAADGGWLTLGMTRSASSQPAPQSVARAALAK